MEPARPDLDALEQQILDSMNWPDNGLNEEELADLRKVSEDFKKWLSVISELRGHRELEEQQAKNQTTFDVIFKQLQAARELVTAMASNLGANDRDVVKALIRCRELGLGQEEKATL